MRVGDVAKQLHCSPEAVRKWSEEGLIPCTRSPHGHRLYKQEDIDAFLGIKPEDRPGATAYYIRVSDGDATALANQLQELTDAYGEPDKVYKDKASGLSEKRPGLRRLIKDAENGKITHVKITYEDRLTRFGFTYLEHIFNQAGVDVEALHQRKNEPQEELMQDFMSLIASFSGKFYKLRSIENQRKLLDEAEEVLDTREEKRNNG